MDENLLQQLNTVWNSQKKVLNPPVAYTEQAIQDWFNAIAHNVASVMTDFPPQRCWSAQFCNTVLPDHELTRKPDIILIDSLLAPLDWRSVHAVAEVTSRSYVHADMTRTINNKTYLMFSTQYNRRFVPFLGICAEKIFFYVTDREGQTVSEICHLQRGTYHALNLLRVIVALMFASPETIGFDPTMNASKGDINTIFCDQEYTVKSTIHAVRGIIGRSTRVWSAFNNKKELCIIKDGWIQEGRADTEREYLAKLKGITGIPELIWGGTVQIHDPNP